MDVSFIFSPKEQARNMIFDAQFIFHTAGPVVEYCLNLAYGKPNSEC